MDLKKDSSKKNEVTTSDKEISVLARHLLSIVEKEKKEDLIDKAKKTLEYPGVKEVLALLATGSFLVLSAVVPALPMLVKPIIDERSSREWRKYNYWYLIRTLKRLKEQKVVEFKTIGDKTIIELTDRGKKKILKYSLKSIQIKKPKFWDKKWRLIIYDVPKEKRKSANNFSQMLEGLGMYRLQKSIFIFPFPCEDEIKFLREFFKISDYVWLLTVSSFENDEVFREFFAI